MTPLIGKQIDYSDNLANTPQPPTSFRPPGQAQDFLAGFNVLSIVIELPRAKLGHGKIGVWATTSVTTDGVTYTQQDRLARPIVNEVLATVSNRRHEVNNKDNPTDDPTQLSNDIQSFMSFPAGRSRVITKVVTSVLVPDVMVADLSHHGHASYLGVETKGATGGRFGGRALTDDVVDTSLGVIFGNTIPKLGLAPDDGKEVPGLTTDNVGPEAKHFTTYLPVSRYPALNNCPDPAMSRAGASHAGRSDRRHRLEIVGRRCRHDDQDGTIPRPGARDQSGLGLHGHQVAR